MIVAIKSASERRKTVFTIFANGLPLDIVWLWAWKSVRQTSFARILQRGNDGLQLNSVAGKRTDIKVFFWRREPNIEQEGLQAIDVNQ